MVKHILDEVKFTYLSTAFTRKPLRKVEAIHVDLVGGNKKIKFVLHQ